MGKAWDKIEVIGCGKYFHNDLSGWGLQPGWQSSFFSVEMADGCLSGFPHEIYCGTGKIGRKRAIDLAQTLEAEGEEVRVCHTSRDAVNRYYAYYRADGSDDGSPVYSYHL